MKTIDFSPKVEDLKERDLYREQATVFAAALVEHGYEEIVNAMLDDGKIPHDPETCPACRASESDW